MPTENLVQWQVYCDTEGQYVTESIYRLESAGAPTECPNDSGHTVGVTSVVETVPPTGTYDADGNLQTALLGADGVAAKVDVRGHLMSTPEIPNAGGTRAATHNFCDKQTWWQESTHHEDAATTTSDQLTYDITGHDYLINIRHKRLTDEHTIDGTTVAPNGNTMTDIVPTVEIDAVALDQALEDATTGDDRYTIDYVNGSVVFAVARDPADVVTISFRKAGSSKYTFKPDSNRRLVIGDVEVDMTQGLSFRMSEGGGITSTVYGSHSLITGGAVVPIQVQRYRCWRDWHSKARRFHGPIPATILADANAVFPGWTFEWRYHASDTLYDTPAYVDTNLMPGSIDPLSMTVNRLEITSDGDLELGGAEGHYLMLLLVSRSLPEM